MSWPHDSRHGRRPSGRGRPSATPPQGVLEFFEECLAGWQAPVGDLSRDELIDRALELANADWSEQEAADELLRLAHGDRATLWRVHGRLQLALLRNPLPDVRGIRASRIALAALRSA